MSRNGPKDKRGLETWKGRRRGQEQNVFRQLIYWRHPKLLSCLFAVWPDILRPSSWLPFAHLPTVHYWLIPSAGPALLAFHCSQSSAMMTGRLTTDAERRKKICSRCPTRSMTVSDLPPHLPLSILLFPSSPPVSLVADWSHSFHLALNLDSIYVDSVSDKWWRRLEKVVRRQQQSSQ